MQIQLLTAATATNGAPTAATDGFELKGSFERAKPGDDAIIFVHSTAGSGTMTVTLKLWGYSKVAAEWAPLGVDSTDADRGKLNDGNAIGEVIANSLEHSEIVQGLRHFDRVYLEVAAIGGTATAVSAWLLART